MRIAFPIHMMPWDAEPSHGIGRYMAELAGALQEHRKDLGLRLTIFQDAYAPTGPFGDLEVERFPSIRDLLGRPHAETRRHAETLTRASTSRGDDAIPSFSDRMRMQAREFLRARHLRSIGPDIVHYSMHFGRPPTTRGIPLVITVHDLVPHLFPETTRQDILFGWRQFLRSCPRAAAFIAVSHAVANDMVEHLGIDGSRIHVVHEGVDTRFRPIGAPDVARDRLRERYGIRSPYILHVGTIEPRKNLETLVRSMEAIREGVVLVLAGSDGWRSAAVKEAVDSSGLGDRVLMPGRIDDADLPDLYGSAEVVAVPSLYEGFGLPLLEAMACETPIVCSDIPVLREVGGEVPVFADPDDPVALGRAIDGFLADPEKAKSHAAQGKARAAEFTWERTARATAAVYKAVIETHTDA